jgi:hypothetical protein
MLEQLPQDQQDILRRRLSAARIEEIEAEAESLTSFYNLCIIAMHSSPAREEEVEREEWWNV